MYATLPLTAPSRVVLHAPDRLRDAEVEDARHAVGADEDVLRGDVAVHEAERLAALAPRLVGGVEALRGRRRRRSRATRGGIGAALLAREARRESASGSPCTYSMTRKSSPSLGHDVERGHDVRVADARGEARLVEEHRDELGIAREVRRAGA